MRRRTLITASPMAALAARQAVAAGPMPWISPDLPDGTRAEAHLARVPGKQPMIELTSNPPNYETPIQAFTYPITPNDQFFVRYHLSSLPDAKSLERWSLEVGGDAAERSVSFTLQQLNDLPQAEVVAVCQCAGNRRGLVQPHVPGVQWAHGAMGCATWHGPRLKDLLARAGLKPDVAEIWFDGADGPLMPGTPDYLKSLPPGKALADDTIVATTMNGGPLPLWNGFPARLVVPGWTGTYWIKHLSRITASTKALDGFWMRKAYRVPARLFPVTTAFATQEDSSTWPITEMVTNSLIASPLDGEEVERSGFPVRGIAWDKGNGIARVEVSVDGGKSWQSSLLDGEISRYSYRSFRFETGPVPRGTAELRVRAISNTKEGQPDVYRPNPAGYHNNVPQRLTVKVV